MEIIALLSTSGRRLIYITIFFILCSPYVSAQKTYESKEKITFVVANYDISGNTGENAVAVKGQQSEKVAYQPLPEQRSTEDYVARLTRYEVKPDYQEQFCKALSQYVVHSMAMKSNIMSEAYYEQENATVLWLIERWKNREALAHGNAGKQFKDIEALAKKALSQPSKILYAVDLEPLSKEQWRKTAKKEDNPLTVMLFIDAKSGTQETFKNVYHIAMPQFRSEPGVVTYQLSQLEGDGTRFVTYEKFRSNEAFQYHLKFPPIQPVIDYLNTSIRRQPFQDGLHNLIEFAPLSRE
jgi:quinol monooxygenase YgiN